MSVLSNTGIRAGASGVVADPVPYRVKRSTRFTSGDSAYLNRTPTAAGNLRKWTWSGWVKRCNLTNYETLFSINNGGSFFIRFQDDKLHFYDQTKNKLTSTLYRDPSAWYHIVIAIDYNNATAADRVKGYINGEQVTWGGVNDTFTQNTDSKLNVALAHSMGRDQGGADNYTNCYLSEVHFIDGIALTPTSFAETNADTGQWVPKKYVHGAFPNNGTTWSSVITATGSGGVSGISTTHTLAKAFDGDDSTYCGTNAGNISTNAAVLTFTFPSGSQPTYNSSVQILAYSGSGETVKAAINGGDWQTVAASGDWVNHTVASGSGTITELKISRQKNNTNNGAAEVKSITVDGKVLLDGADDNSFHLAMDPANSGTNYSGSRAEAVGGSMQNGGTPYIIDMSPADAQFQYYSNTGGAYRVFNGNVIDTAANMAYLSDLNETTVWTLDLRDEGTVTSVKVHGSGGEDYGSTADGDNWVCSLLDSSKSAIANTSVTLTSATATWWTVPVTGTPRYLKFTQTTGTGPLFLTGIQVNGRMLTNHTSIGYDSSGNKNHWHENNLFSHEATVANDNFKVVTYTGNGSSKAVTGLGFKPDLVWIKRTDATQSHGVFDSVRGVHRWIESNNTTVEDYDTSFYIDSFDTDGFTVAGGAIVNNDTSPYVAWCWKAGGAALSNSDGTITSSVSANTTAGFSIVKYEGNGSGSQTVGHGLGAAPDLILCKTLESSVQWVVYHSALGKDKYLGLNTTDAAGDYTSYWGAGSTSTTFGLQAASGGNNKSGEDLIAYCWTEKAGVSKFGSYKGSGASGNSVDCGFTPAFVMIKRSGNGSDGDTTYGGWGMYQEGKTDKQLMANCDEEQGARGSCAVGADIRDIQANVEFTANGFTLSSGWYEQNDTADFIFAAFAGSPGVDLDLLADTPEAPYDNELNGGGNYCTLNPLDNGGIGALSNGNLTAKHNANSWKFCRATQWMTTGKWYWETTVEGAIHDGSNGQITGICSTDGLNDSSSSTGKWTRQGQVKNDESTNSTVFTTVALGQIFGWAYDADAGKLWTSTNGVWEESGNPATGASENYTTSAGLSVTPTVGLYGSSCQFTLNFGQREFAYTPPSGFKALNTYNLPDPTITDPSTGFGVITYDGNGNARTLTGLNQNPDLIWIKSRSAEQKHTVVDSVRTTATGEYIAANDSQTEGTGVHISGTTNGITIADPNAATIWYNDSSHTYVAWAWDAGTSNVTKSAGDLNSTAYLQGEVYSSVLVGYSTAHGSQFQTGAEATKAFDGTVGSAWNEGAAPLGAGAGTYIRFTPSSQVASNTVEVYVNYYNEISFYTGSPGSSTKVAGPFFTTTSGYFTLVDCGTVPAWDYMQIDVPSGVGNLGCYFGGIRIGGKLLVDSNVTPTNVPTIASTYRANPNTGFSIVSFDSGSSGNQTIAHGLNDAPKFILNKNLEAANNWTAYHVDGTGLDKYLLLNHTQASTANTAIWGTDNPTSLVFGFESGTNSDNNDDCIAYCWSEVAGYSKFGSWTSTGDSFVYCGFKPRFLMAKCTSHAGDWVMYDTERDPSNQDADNNTLVANVADEEDGYYTAAQTSVDLLSNGFKIRHSGSAPLGDSGRTYCFAAWAQTPFKYANAR